MNLDNLLLVLADLLLKSTAVFALAAFVAGILRSASAAVRHMIWLAAFILVLLLPFTKAVSPKWAYGLMINPQHLLLHHQTLSGPEIERAKSAGSDNSQTISLAIKSDWRHMVVAVWMGGFVLLLGYRATGSLQLRKIRSQSREVNADRLLALTRQIARTNGTQAELRESDDVSVPMTWGIWRAVILLPSQAVEWPDGQLTSALQHEFAHIRRRDCLSRLVAQIATAIYWMNPLVWLAARQLRLAQEIACDDSVLCSGIGATEYASQLVDVVRSLHMGHPSVPHALAMAHPSTLETRIRSIVEPQLNRRPVTSAGVATSIICATAMLFLLTLAHIRAADTPSGDSETPVAKPVAQVENGQQVPLETLNSPVKDPVTIDGDAISYENKVAICTGNATLAYDKLVIKADVIRYNPDKKDVEASGHVQLAEHGMQGDNTTHADKLTYNLETHKMTCVGPSGVHTSK